MKTKIPFSKITDLYEKNKSSITQNGVLINGDTRELIKKIPINSIDVTITSPPYFDLKDYKHKNQIGNGQLYDSYLNDLRDIFARCFDITKPTGSLWVVIDTFTEKNKTKLLPFEIVSKLEEIGWSLQEIIIWQKDRTIPWTSKGKFRKSFEYILFFVKTPDYKFYIDRIRTLHNLKRWWVRYPERYNPKGKVPTDVWEIPLQFQGAWGGDQFPRHLCPFPFELVERIINLATDKGDIVFDPFAGTGSVLAQAEVMGRYHIGFEINANFMDEYESKTISAAKKRYLVDDYHKTDEFRKLLIFLRALKYGSILIKEHRKTSIDSKGNSILPTAGIVLIDKQHIKDPQLPIPIELVLCWESKISQKFEMAIESLTLREPLSLYGVKPEIVNISKKSDILAFIKQKKIKKVYQYSVGNTHKYKKTIICDKILDNIGDDNLKQIPIFSNIKLNVDDE